jgi:hypothetical protein
MRSSGRSTRRASPPPTSSATRSAGTIALQLAAPGRAESVVARYLHDWLPHADWIVLDGVGHCPQLDVPLETAQLILGLTSP